MFIYYTEYRASDERRICVPPEQSHGSTHYAHRRFLFAAEIAFYRLGALRYRPARGGLYLFAAYPDAKSVLFYKNLRALPVRAGSKHFFGSVSVERGVCELFRNKGNVLRREAELSHGASALRGNIGRVLNEKEKRFL